jgi:hypothetical protein
LRQVELLDPLIELDGELCLRPVRQGILATSWLGGLSITGDHRIGDHRQGRRIADMIESLIEHPSVH